MNHETEKKENKTWREIFEGRSFTVETAPYLRVIY